MVRRTRLIIADTQKRWLSAMQLLLDDGGTRTRIIITIKETLSAGVVGNIKAVDVLVIVAVCAKDD